MDSWIFSCSFEPPVTFVTAFDSSCPPFGSPPQGPTFCGSPRSLVTTHGVGASILKWALVSAAVARPAVTTRISRVTFFTLVLRNGAGVPGHHTEENAEIHFAPQTLRLGKHQPRIGVIGARIAGNVLAITRNNIARVPLRDTTSSFPIDGRLRPPATSVPGSPRLVSPLTLLL